MICYFTRRRMRYSPQYSDNLRPSFRTISADVRPPVTILLFVRRFECQSPMRWVPSMEEKETSHAFKWVQR